MIKVNYTELDGPAGPTCRLEASGHAGYAPAGQDIVCAGASTLMQTLCALLAGEEGTRSGVWDEPDGPRLAVTAAAPQKPWVEGAFEFAKAGFALLAERYPDNVRFADLSGRGEQSMVDLQLFASEGGDAAAPSAPALSHAQAQQAIASGTMKADEGREASDVPTPAAVQEPEERPAPPERPALLPPSGRGGREHRPRPPRPLGGGRGDASPGYAGFFAQAGAGEPRDAPPDGAARDADG